jgi:hypothetical protein
MSMDDQSEKSGERLADDLLRGAEKIAEFLGLTREQLYYEARRKRDKKEGALADRERRQRTDCVEGATDSSRAQTYWLRKGKGRRASSVEVQTRRPGRT